MNLKLLKKSSKLLMIMAVLVTSFISSMTKNIDAVTLKLPSDTGYTYKGINFATKKETNMNIWRITVDGNKETFCIESHVLTSNGGGYVSDEFAHSQKNKLSQIVYYGFSTTKKTKVDFAVTQVMVWEAVGDKLISTNIPNYKAKKKAIMAKVNKHNTLPSWNTKTYSVKVGQPLTINDTNAILPDMKLVTNATNTTLSSSGNNLTITATANSKNGKITYNKVDKSFVGASLVYKKPGFQTVVTLKLANAKPASLNINIIKLGNVKVQKIDEETQKPLPKTTIRFEYAGTTKDIVTNNNGVAQLTNIEQGTKIKITEVTAPNGYVNKHISKEVTIEPNKTVSVILNNKAQKGKINLKKIGYKPVSFSKEESKYGDMFSFNFDYRPLANTSFNIKAVEDIIVGGTTHFKANDIVASLTTDDKGELINNPYLYLGKYEAIETTAPNGYLVDPTPIPFEFEYAGQEIELLQTDATHINDFQKLTLSLFKNEEFIKSWKDNLPTIIEKPANDKVFGLYTNQEFSFEDEEILPIDSLLAIVTIKDGKLVLDNLQYPEGKYYFKELDSGVDYKLLEDKYKFEFIAEDNKQTKDITINDKDDRPLLNELHFNKFSLMKLNEVKGKEGTFEKSKGAVFSLLNNKQKVIQTIKVNNESLASFKYVPVGTFYLKEIKPSSNAYQLWNSKYKIESNKYGLTVYDDEGKVVATQKYGEEKPYLFTLNNYLIPEMPLTGSTLGVFLIISCMGTALCGTVYLLTRRK